MRCAIVQLVASTIRFVHIMDYDRAFIISSKIIEITGTEIAFPANVYNFASETSGKRYVDGKPCRLKHSRGVHFRIPLSSKISRTLCPPCPIFAVSVGHTFDLFSLTYPRRSWYTLFVHTCLVTCARTNSNILNRFV